MNEAIISSTAVLLYYSNKKEEGMAGITSDGIKGPLQ